MTTASEELKELEELMRAANENEAPLVAKRESQKRKLVEADKDIKNLTVRRRPEF